VGLLGSGERLQQGRVGGVRAAREKGSDVVVELWVIGSPHLPHTQ
jgi:hypothetical protein